MGLNVKSTLCAMNGPNPKKSRSKSLLAALGLKLTLQTRGRPRIAMRLTNTQKYKDHAKDSRSLSMASQTKRFRYSVIILRFVSSSLDPGISHFCKLPKPPVSPPIVSAERVFIDESVSQGRKDH